MNIELACLMEIIFSLLFLVSEFYMLISCVFFLIVLVVLLKELEINFLLEEFRLLEVWFDG